MRPWLAVLLAGCEGSEDKEPPRPEPNAQTGDTGHPVPVDSDGDGFYDTLDCAPDDPTTHPGAPELCNGLDDDCDGAAERDADGDGVSWCDDCDEQNPDIHPGAPDAVGDWLDANCDGTDGEGTTLPPPWRTGETELRTTGLALAGGDVDGDGCAELLIGEPGGWANLPPMEDSVTLGIGCWPWADGLRSFTAEYWYMGYNGDLAPGLVAVHEWGWEAPRGRVLLFDETFGPTATPLLEVRGGGDLAIDSIVLLGEPAQWLLMGEQASLDFPSEYILVDVGQRGVLDFDTDEPDLRLATDTFESSVGALVGDVGDRDGDGEVDLAVVGEEGTRQARFFPQVTGGHVGDAPEVWTDATPGSVEFGVIRTGGDLDGDGRNEAVYASLNSDGEQETTGRAFLVPWLGSGEFDLDSHAPTRLDGELSRDWFGYESEVADLDGDGQDDLLLGAPGYFLYEDIIGKVLLFPGPLPAGVLTTADAAVLWVGEQPGDHAGAALAAGDFDGSGRMDIAIGAPFADRDDLMDAGTVYVLIDPL